MDSPSRAAKALTILTSAPYDAAVVTKRRPPSRAPLLRWAGSKRSLLPVLERCLPPFPGRYIEPFAGSACLFFATQPPHAVLGDLNEDLINFYRVLRRAPRAVFAALCLWPTDRSTYYDVRSLRPAALPAPQRAARFLYLNRLCFNGVYRTNRSGAFNVPFGTRNGSLPTEAHLLFAASVLSRCDIRSGDFETVVQDAEPGDFVYLDPPYTQNPDRAYGVYGYGSFDHRDLSRMVSCLHRLDDSGIPFLFSYADTPILASAVGKTWRVLPLSAPSRVAARTTARGTRRELLITNQRTLTL